MFLFPYCTHLLTTFFPLPRLPFILYPFLPALIIMSSASTPFNSNSLAATPNETPVATPPPNATEAYQPLPAARDIHMILSDVDGTLFTSDHELHHK